MSESEPLTQPGLFRSLLQLVRFPAVFTVVADVMMGHLMTHSPLDIGLFSHLLGASVCYYWAGMVFNDLFDANRDADTRPERPIPSGRISAKLAAGIGFGLLIAGTVTAGIVGRSSLWLGLLLTASIVLYDAILKSTPVAPLAMGACRFFNVLLAASAGLSWSEVWQIPQLLAAAGMGIYIVGVTWFARSEATLAPSRVSLYGGAIVLLAGLGVFAALPEFHVGFVPSRVRVLLALIAGGLLIRVFHAIRTGLPRNVGLAVKSMILSIITIDAVLIYFQTGSPKYAITCIFLIVPAVFLARRIAVT